MRAARAAPIAGYYLLYFATVGVTLPFIPVYFRSLGLSASEVGTLLAIGPAFALVAPPLWGHLADRWARPDRVLRLLSWGAALGFAPLLWARGYPAVAASLAIYAVFNSAITALIDGISLQRVKAEGGAFARLRMWGSIGFIAASAAFGRWVDASGRGAVAVPLALIAAYAIWASTVRAEGRPPAPESPLAGLALLKQRPILLLLIATALHWIACSPYHGMFAIHIQALGLPQWVVGLSAAVGVIAEVGVMWIQPRLAGRVSARQLLALAFVGSAVRWVGTAFATQAPSIVLLNLLHGLTFGAFYVASIEWVGTQVPDAMRSRGQALFASFTFGVGGLVGYLGAGAGYDLLGRSVFLVAAGVELLALLFIGLQGLE